MGLNHSPNKGLGPSDIVSIHKITTPKKKSTDHKMGLAPAPRIINLKQTTNCLALIQNPPKNGSVELVVAASLSQALLGFLLRWVKYKQSPRRQKVTVGKHANG